MGLAELKPTSQSVRDCRGATGLGASPYFRLAPDLPIITGPEGALRDRSFNEE